MVIVIKILYKGEFITCWNYRYLIAKIDIYAWIQYKAIVFVALQVRSFIGP